MIYLDNNNYIQEVYIPRQEYTENSNPEYATVNELETAIANEVIRSDGKYATKSELSAATGNVINWVEENYMTSADTQEAISAATDDMATETWVNSQGFITEHQSLSAYSTTEQMNAAILSAKTEVESQIPTNISDLENDLNFVNSGDVQTQIDNSISGKQDVLVSGVNIKTINNESILGSGNIEIQGGGAEYEAGQNIAIDANNVISVTGINSYTGITSEDVVDALGFTPISGVDLSDYYTKEEVDAEITASTSAFTTSGEVQSQINDSISGLASEQYVQNAVSGKADSSRVEEIEQVTASALTELENTKLDASAMSAYSTTVEVEGMISSATSGFATEQYVDNSVSGLASETYVQNSISGLASTTYVDNSVSGKADISSLSAYTTSADVKTQIESYGYVNSGEVETQITDKGYITGYTETDPIFTGSPAYGITSGDIANWNSKVDASALTQYATNEHLEEVEEVTASALAQLQNSKLDASAMSAYTPSSGFATINGSAITEGGNLVIEGGGGTTYQAGDNIQIQNNTISVTGITSYTGITSGDVTTALGFTPISSTDFESSDRAVSEALNDINTRVNAVSANSVTSGEVETQITEKGYITGYTETDPVFQASPASGISAQDISDWNDKLDASALTPYYTSAQTNTAISNATSGLASTTYVNNAVSGKVGSTDVTTIVKMTQAQYDAISGSASPTTLYIITD